MIGHGQGEFGAADLAAAYAQRLEGLGAGHLVNEVTVDIDQAGSIIAAFHEMSVPDLFV